MVNDYCALTLKSYDPYVSQALLPNQQPDLQTFLDHVDMVVILVGHDEIRKNADALKGKVVLDCCNLPELAGAYHL